MNRPLLNDDVLLSIMSFCSTMGRGTVCTLIQTSRLFHHAGARYLLANGVSLHNEQVDSFVTFMIADGDYRFPLLRTLTLSTTTLSLFSGYVLAQLFHRLARHGALCSLKLDDTETILRSHPELPYAIAELPKLKSLCMYNIGRHGRTLLNYLRSELVYANLGVPYQAFMGRDDGQIEGRAGADAVTSVVDDGDDLITALHQSLRSLRELHMTYARDYSQAQTLVFPCLTSLTLHAGLLDAPVTGYFSHMFPNLRQFEVYTFNRDHKPFDISDFVGRRNRNIDNQLECGRWRTLRYYEGTLEALFSLGIKCHIDWVKLKSEDSALDPFMISEVLRDACPVHLCLEFWDASSLLDDDFLEIFEKQGVRRLETLHIKILSAEGEEDLAEKDILESITSRIVVPLRSLKEFRLAIECCFWDHDFGLMSDDDTPSELAPQEVEEDDFAESLVRASAAASGSLVSVSVKLPTSYTSLKRGRGGEFGPPTRDFHTAYGAMVNATYPRNEDDKKAWSGVRRLF